MPNMSETRATLWLRLAILTIAAGALLPILASRAEISPAAFVPAEEQAPAPLKVEPAAENHFVGPNACANCHHEPGEKVEEWWRFNQIKTWETQDRHRIAAKVLSQPRAKVMQELLVKADPSYSAGVETDSRCLACHGPDTRPKGSKAASSGVDCEACHGASERWLVPHFSRNGTWWERTVDEKLELGFRSMHVATVRAETCYSCHIGDSAKNRVVTHDMYAAGHPPLPSIELSAFSESQYPKHWQRGDSPGKKAVNYLPANAWTHYRSKLAVVGGIESLAQSLGMMHLEAKRSANNAAGKWPELALYDCAACHHDLTLPSYRQEWAGGQVGKKGFGRPAMVYWPQVIARVVLAKPQIAGDIGPQLLANLEKVENAITAVPYGQREEIANSAGPVIEQLKALAQKLNAMEFNTEIRKALLMGLLEAGSGKEITTGDKKHTILADYDSTRQLLWAIESVIADSGEIPNIKRVQEILFEKPEAMGVELQFKGAAQDTAQTKYLDEFGKGLAIRREFRPKVVAERMKSALSELLATK